jgi:hypothetical protein
MGDYQIAGMSHKFNPCSAVTPLREEIFYSAVSTVICCGAIGHHQLYWKRRYRVRKTDFYVSTLEMSMGRTAEAALLRQIGTKNQRLSA